MPKSMADVLESVRSPDTGLEPSVGAATLEPPPVWTYRVTYTDGSFEVVDSLDRLSREQLDPRIVGRDHLVYAPAWILFRVPDGRTHFVRTHATRSILEVKALSVAR